MKRILFLIIILLLFSGIASGTELGAGDGTGYPDAIDTDTSVEVDYPDPLATTARAAVPNDTNAAVIAIETELGINPSGAYDTVKARLDAGFGELSFTDLDDTPANYTGQAGKYTKVNVGETALEFGTIDLSLYYLKTEINTLSKVETIYTKDIIDSDELAALKFIDLADTPAAYDNGKYAKSTADGIVWDDPAGGGASTFLELTDTPGSYGGHGLEILRVNGIQTGVEFSGVAIETTLTVDSDAKVPTSKAVNDFCETTKDYKGKNYYSALGSDHTYSDNADTDSQPVGEAVAFGDLLYPDWTAGEWLKTDADLAAKMPGLRIALESKTDGQICLMLVKGYIRDDSDFQFAGAMVYASPAPGDMSSAAPSAAGQQLQRVGVAQSADILFFDPSIDVGEIKP